MTDGLAFGSPTLSGRQKAFADRLGEESPLLRQAYLGALDVLQRAENPDRFALAAHGIRELMEKIPEYLEVDMPAHHEDLRGKVTELDAKWSKASAESKCLQNGSWEGAIDKPLKFVLKEIGAFFDWFKSHMPRRKQEVGNVLKELDGTRQPLPEPLQDLNISYWEKIQRFFISVSHHRKKTDDDEFGMWLGSLETFLLERLSPRTFADIDEIDALLDPGKGNANP